MDDIDVTSPMGPLPTTMSVPEAGELLGIKATTARRLAKIYRETGGAYGIPNIRVGHKLRVPGVLFAEQAAQDRITPPDFADELAPRRRGPGVDGADNDSGDHGRRSVSVGGRAAGRLARRPRRESPPDQLPLFPAG